MGKCKYCGQDAGIFHSKHSECEQRHNSGVARVKSIFKGHPVETTYMQRIGTGSVCLTDKNLYFHCPEKTLKIPFSKILSVDPYSNGMSIQKDGVNDKPMLFENLNSWFCYNVIANLK